MEDHQFAILGVSEFADTLTSSNMAWHHLPIDAVNERIAPIGNVYLADVQAVVPVVPEGPRTGADMYQTTCLGYHGTNRLTK